MIQETLKLLTGNSFFEILLIAVVLDTILGVLRAIKEHKFNSCVGIDGAIRKAAMLLRVGLLMLVDYHAHQYTFHDSGAIHKDPRDSEIRCM